MEEDNVECSGKSQEQYCEVGGQDGQMSSDRACGGVFRMLTVQVHEGARGEDMEDWQDRVDESPFFVTR